MAISRKRARVLLLALAAIVVLVVSGYLASGYFRQRAMRKDLPAKLGLNIQQDSTGFTVSKSENGHTIFTLHAAHAVQFRAGGDARLKDVRITLYGPPGSQRQDRIEGGEFAFNQSTGIASADGDVEIDLQGLTYSSSRNAVDVTANPDRGTIHLRTRGLTFSQKTGVAETSQHTEFRLPQAAGSADGARYDSASGVLTLQSNVTLHTSVHGDTNTVTATHAVLSRADRHVSLDHARLQSSSDRTLAADHAIVALHEDGTLEAANADGNVTATTGAGAMASAPHAVAHVADSQIREIHLDGGVTFSQARVRGSNSDAGAEDSSPPPFSGDGTSQSADLIFAPADNTLEALHLRGAVRLGEVATKGTQRSLQAAAVDVSFHDRKPRSIDANGSPVYSESGASAKGATRQTLSADTLQAVLNGAGQVESLDGHAHAHAISVAADGSTSDTAADRLHAVFSGAGRDRNIQTVTEDGDVHLHQQPSKAGAAPQNATAAHAIYEAASDTALLTGAPRWSDGAMSLSAVRVTVHRAQQTAVAEEQVKCTYAQAGAAEAAHVIADSAVFHSEDKTAQFRGSVRLWQGSNAIAAPAIRLAGESHELTAEAAGDTLVRATLLAQAGGAQTRGDAPGLGADSAEKKSGSATPDTVMITGRQLVYSDAGRVAHFTGGVVMHSRDATIHAQTLDAYLAQPPVTRAAPAGKQGPQAPHAADAAPIAMAGRLERAVFRGTVTLQQPGRSGSGDELAYTAADGKFILTGSTARQPRLDDAVKGSVTGNALIFGSRDDTVRVEGGARRTVTTTYTGKQ